VRVPSLDAAWAAPAAAGRHRRLGLLLLRAAAVAAGAGGIATFVVPALAGRFSGPSEDFSIQLAAGQAANAGADPYATFTPHSATTLVRGLGFDYPPLVAWLMRPLAAMPHDLAVSLWLLIGVTATLIGCIVVALTAMPRSWPRIELAVITAFGYAAATYNLWHGNANFVVFLCLALAFRAWVKGNEVRCGLLLAAGAAFKLAPIVLVVLLIRRGWWRGAAAAVGAFAGSLALGMLLVGRDALTTYATQVLPVLTRDDGWLQNQSWNALVSRAVDRNVLTVDGTVAVAHWLAMALGLAGLLAAVWAVCARDRGSAVRAAEFGAGVVAMLLAGTVTWYEHYVHLVIPLAGAAALVALRPRRSTALTAALLACVAVFGVLVPTTIATTTIPDILAMRQGSAWWVHLQLYSLPTLAAAGLLGALVVALRTAEAARMPSGGQRDRAGDNLAVARLAGAALPVSSCQLCADPRRHQRLDGDVAAEHVGVEDPPAAEQESPPQRTVGRRSREHEQRDGEQEQVVGEHVRSARQRRRHPQRDRGRRIGAQAIAKQHHGDHRRDSQRRRGGEPGRAVARRRGDGARHTHGARGLADVAREDQIRPLADPRPADDGDGGPRPERRHRGEPEQRAPAAADDERGNDEPHQLRLDED
jgi:hypothetical protein